jgi:ribosomal-protein-alanine N-acetyltransferase
MDPSDLDGVLAIEKISSLQPWSRAMFLEEMANPASSCFVIRLTGEIGLPPHPLLSPVIGGEGWGEGVVGFLCSRIVEDESELLNLSVHPEYRRKGIGKRLMDFCISFCKKRNIQKLYLEVSASNQAAISLYQSFSFQTVGTRPMFYRNQFDALVMMKEI